MKHRRRWAVALLFALTLPAAGARAAEPLEIPALLPTTGPAAFLGQEFAETLRLLEARVNRSGGINGRPLRFDIEDTQSSPQVALQLATAAISKQPAVIIDGGPLALCASVAPLFKNGPVLWCLTPSFRPEPGGYSYSATASSRDCLLVALNYFRSRGFRKIAILNGTDATGADADVILGDLIKLPQTSGMSFVANEHFNLGDLNVSAQMARIKASGAQALISYVTSSPVATVLHGAADAGLDIPILTSAGNMSVAQLDAYKAFIPKELLFAAYPALNSGTVTDAAVQQRIDAFRSDMRGAGFSTDMLHALPWDPVLLLVDTFKRIGPRATARRVRDDLSSNKNWPGILGRYDFVDVPNRGVGVRSIVISRWDANRSVWVPAGAGVQ